MNAYIEVVGLIASLMSFVLWWPQAALVWRSRRRCEQLGACRSPPSSSSWRTHASGAHTRSAPVRYGSAHQDS